MPHSIDYFHLATDKHYNRIPPYKTNSPLENNTNAVKGKFLFLFLFNSLPVGNGAKRK